MKSVSNEEVKLIVNTSKLVVLHVYYLIDHVWHEFYLCWNGRKKEWEKKKWKKERRKKKNKELEK